MNQDSPEYLQRKKFVDRLLTVYGRKPVLEALNDSKLKIYRLHLADSNKPANIIDDMIHLATQRQVEIVYHDRKALSRISKNSKQDQGVALDIVLRGFIPYQDFLAQYTGNHFQLIALDNITNPQNLGMIIRSACASPLTGIILPRMGCARLDSLVIKASAGTLFKATILRCDSLDQCLQDFKNQGAVIAGLDVSAQQSLITFQPDSPAIYVLGNETEGLAAPVKKTCTQFLKIPMANGVESLNVAITAGLIAFRNVI